MKTSRRARQAPSARDLTALKVTATALVWLVAIFCLRASPPADKVIKQDAANGVIGAAHARINFREMALPIQSAATGLTVGVPSQVITISRRLGGGGNFRFFVSAATPGTAVVLPC
jgi:hypothetical protein